MGARFAGSQRLGDRRRRRLAVETDDPGVSCDRQGQLPAPAGSSRGIDRPHSNSRPSRIPFQFARAIATFVPQKPWTYLLGGLAGLATAGFLLIAGGCAADWSAVAGSGIEHLFA